MKIENMETENIKTRNYVVSVLVVALVVMSGVAFYYYRVSRGSAQPNNQVNVPALVAKVGKLIVLPVGEIPTVATVVDPNLLKEQAFFANAAKGDLVLIYTGAKKAVLFNPSANKIVEVAPITIGNPAPTANTDTAPSTDR